MNASIRLHFTDGIRFGDFQIVGIFRDIINPRISKLRLLCANSALNPKSALFGAAPAVVPFHSIKRPAIFTRARRPVGYAQSIGRYF